MKRKARRCTPIIPALWKQRQVDLCEFKIHLVNKVSSRTVRETKWNVVAQAYNPRNGEQSQD